MRCNKKSHNANYTKLVKMSFPRIFLGYRMLGFSRNIPRKSLCVQTNEPAPSRNYDVNSFITMILAWVTTWARSKLRSSGETFLRHRVIHTHARTRAKAIHTYILSFTRPLFHSLYLFSLHQNGTSSRIMSFLFPVVISRNENLQVDQNLPNFAQKKLYVNHMLKRRDLSKT